MISAYWKGLFLPGTIPNCTTFAPQLNVSLLDFNIKNRA